MHKLARVAAAGGRARNFPGRRRPRLPKTLAAAARDAADAIAAYPNVHYVTLAEKQVANAPTGMLAVVAYVSSKQDMAADDRIPDAVEVRFGNGRRRLLATDVVELHSAPRTLGMRAGNIVRAADGDQGMCGLTFDHNGAAYMITNAHVVANIATQSSAGEPGVIDPATQAVLPIGHTVYISDFGPNAVTTQDLAIVRATSVDIDPHYIVGEASPIAAFGHFAQMAGATFWYNVNGARVVLDSPQPVINQKVEIHVDGCSVSYANSWALRVVH